MLQVGQIEAGSRHDLHVGLSPDAPDESALQEDPQGAFGYCHSYETASRYDGPGTTGRLVHVRLPAALLLLPQSRYLAPQRRHLRCSAGSHRSTRQVRPCIYAH